MMIEIRRPELERMVEEEIVSGHFQNAEDLLTEALNALRNRNRESVASAPQQNLADFLLHSPFAGSDLNLERQQDYGRPFDL